jgi:predicted transcriptional regulator
MRMQDMMRRAVTVGPRDTITTVAMRMREGNASSCLVIDDDAIVGMVSERDLVTKLIAENRHPGEVSVRDIMTAIPPATREQTQDRLVDLLGTPASALEDAEGAYELALTGAPIDLHVLAGME